jgi:hypothetical protein
MKHGWRRGTVAYLALSEVLSKLDAQQRKELAALAARADASEVRRARNAKKRLSDVSVFFIERSWEEISPQLMTFSVEGETGKSAAEIEAFLDSLRRRQPDYAWGWIRARMDARLMAWIEACMPELLAQYPEMADLYTQSLRRVGQYWFRETPIHHLKAGYHTALGVACKWYGSTFELLKAERQPCPAITSRFRDELRAFATFSLTMLVRTDGYLWDSAGARALNAIIDDGTLKIAARPFAKLCLELEPDYGVRLGCPALRARGSAEPPAFAGILDWVEDIFSRYLLHSDLEGDVE